MRLWSLHPSYVDRQGLLALWREGLLAQNVLLGKTKGYKNHPQLIRFKALPEPASAIATYLHAVVDEAEARGYRFQRDKIIHPRGSEQIDITDGQLAYEFQHLLNKLKVRDPERFERFQSVSDIRLHPMCVAIVGGVADWEVVS